MLVVDDDPTIHQLLGKLLRLHGFSPIHGTSIADALSIVGEHTVQAVILDLGLGAGQSGLDILRWLRAQARFANTPVLVLTGKTALTPEEQAAIEYQRAHLFFKPQKLSVLIQELRRMLDV